METSSSLLVSALRTRSGSSGLFRLEAAVLGEPLWFETGDGPLAAQAETYGCALLPASLHRGQTLELTDPVCPRWEANLPRIVEMFHSWWQYPALVPRVRSISTSSSTSTSTSTSASSVSDLRASRRSTAEPQPSPKRALCFSGGVDSFYTLLRHPEPIDLLLFAHGYDLELHRHNQWTQWERAFRRIAAARGTEAVVIRTNLRTHPAFRGTRWAHAHGAALACLGHLLHHRAGHLVISSSQPYAMGHPWGSHWDLDPLWGSSKLSISHYGADHWRKEKLLLIADDPLVQNHLRVCWKSHDAGYNCSRCEKCVRTQLVLEGAGRLQSFSVFDTSESLRRRIDRLPYLDNPDLIPVYQGIASGQLSPEVKAAIRRLIRRSEIALHPWMAFLTSKWKKLKDWPSRRERRRLAARPAESLNEAEKAEHNTGDTQT